MTSIYEKLNQTGPLIILIVICLGLSWLLIEDTDNLITAHIIIAFSLGLQVIRNLLARKDRP